MAMKSNQKRIGVEIIVSKDGKNPQTRPNPLGFGFFFVAEMGWNSSNPCGVVRVSGWKIIASTHPTPTKNQINTKNPTFAFRHLLLKT
jgi:hypothetical protein